MGNEILDQGIAPNAGNATQVPQRNLPNSGGILAMGIISIVLGFGIIGLILGIISTSMGNKAVADYKRNPDLYTLSSYKNAKAGRTCGIIGMSLFGLAIIILVIVAAANS